MNKILRLSSIALLPFIMCGCVSYCEISERIPEGVKVDDGEKPLAVVHVENYSYRLFGFIPFSSGETPDEIEPGRRHSRKVRFFTDKATIDNNLKTVKAAARYYNTDRVSNLRTKTDSSSLWSLFLFNRRSVRTSCLLLEQTPEQTSLVK